MNNNHYFFKKNLLKGDNDIQIQRFELWNFEFGLNNEARYKIARSYNIFVNLHDIMISKQDKYTLLDKILEPVNAMVSNGRTDSDKQSGCIVVLYALAFIFKFAIFQLCLAC